MSETPFVLGINPNYKKEGVAINSMPVNRPAFNSVINKNKNDKITFSEETKLISKNPKLKKYGIDLNKPFQVTPELIEKMKAKGPKDFFENLKDGAKNAIPFLSGAFEIKKNIDLLAIVKKQEKGKQLSAKEKELLYYFSNFTVLGKEHRMISFFNHTQQMKESGRAHTLWNWCAFPFGRAMLVPTNRAKRYRGPRKVLRSKLFGERRNKCSKLKRFAREPFSLAKFVWTSGCPAHHSSLFSIHYSLRESFFHAKPPKLSEAHRIFKRFAVENLICVLLLLICLQKNNYLQLLLRFRFFSDFTVLGKEP